MEAKPRTFSQLGALLAKRWSDHGPGDLAQGVRALVPLVQVPPRAVWSTGGQALHTSAESWLGCARSEMAAASPSVDRLVTRYLAAFGPASVKDAQAWSGLTGLREVIERLRPRLRAFRDERGAELFDLPDGPLPGADVCAPVRLVAEFDNLILSHADRTRVISERNRKRLFTRNGIFPGTVLVDGFAVGRWRIARSRGAATLTVELFDPIRGRDRDAVTREGGRLLAGYAPDAETHDIRFEPAP